MSDDELEIVFENVSDSCPSTKQKSKEKVYVVKVSSDGSAAKIPRISIEEAEKIKLETSQYLKQQIGNLKTKYNSEHERTKQLKVNQPPLKLKSVKNGNINRKRKIAIQNKTASPEPPKTQLLPSVKDNSNNKKDYSNGHEKVKGTEATGSKELVPALLNILREDVLGVLKKTSSVECGKSNRSNLIALSRVFPQSVQENDGNSNVLSLSPSKSTKEGEELNDSVEKSHPLETPQCSQKNTAIVLDDSSTDVSGGSKNCGTSLAELLQCTQKNNSILLGASTSTSESNLQIKDQSSASPSSTETKIKLSYQLSKRPNKFFINGSPASSPKNSNLYSNVKKSPKSKHQKSPLTFMRKNFPRNQLSDTRSVRRQLNFSSGSSEVENGEISLDNNPLVNETEPGTSLTQMHPYTDAYLLRQLKLHTDVVLEDNSSRCLINDQEMDIIKLFFDMSSECQDLYARMHNRKYKWNRLSDIRYDSATESNVRILKENGFFVTDLQNVDLADLLDLLKISEVKGLCKSLGIKPSKQNKMSCSAEIINYCQSQKTLGFQLEVTTSENVVKKRIGNLLGTSFIVSSETRGLFRCIHLLFNLKFNRNEQSAYGSQDLFDIQFVGTEKALYPKCSIDETAKIFASREDVLKYQVAEDIKMDFLSAVDTKNLNKAETLLNTIRRNFICELDFISELDDSPSQIAAHTLPLSLRKFTPGTVYAYLLSQGVEVLKKLKKRETAVNDLMLLLDQTKFLPYMRGRWYEKLLILHRTAGRHVEVAKTMRVGLRDPHVDDQGLYVMSCRSKELLKKKGVDKQIKLMLTDIPLFPEMEYVDRTEIRASALEGKSGYKRVYIQDDGSGDGKTYSSVEELVKSHYCPRVFKHGIHAENSLVSSLFGILLWDIIYEYHVPCAFISPYQTRPLDLSTGEFYRNRQSAIDTKLAQMSKWTEDDVSSWVTEVYSKHHGKSSVVHWKWFSNSAIIVNIINCIGLQVISKICERYAKKYRGVRSGFPDLFLWSPGEKDKYKFVEVKGPKDTLGTNQKLWLDFLVKINANVEVCSVLAQGSKTAQLKNQRLTQELNSTSKDGAEVIEV